MSAVGALVIVAVWALIGVSASIWMGRHGHEPFGWGTLGSLLGPSSCSLPVPTRERTRDLAAVVSVAAAVRRRHSSAASPSPFPAEVPPPVLIVSAS